MTPQLTADRMLRAMVRRLVAGVNLDQLASETGTRDRKEAAEFIARWVDEDIAAIEAAVIDRAVEEIGRTHGGFGCCDSRTLDHVVLTLRSGQS